MTSRKKVKRAIVKAVQEERQKRVEMIRPVPVLSSLRDHELYALADVAAEKVYAAGEMAVEQGEMADKLIVVLEGGFRLYQKTPKGKRQPLAILKRGMWIGEMALLTKRLCQADVVAASDVRCLVITRKQVEFTLGPMMDLVKHRDARHYLQLLQLAI
jgi:CRP-like cAMP-binding protein